MFKKNRYAKTLALILLSAVMMLAGAFGAFAETIGNSTGWERTAGNGWRYIKGDGHMAADEWIWIGEESTGYRCYFFDGSGNLVTNAITAEGYRVNSNGAWEENGVEQVRLFFDTTRAPFGYEITNGSAVAPVTLSSYFTSLIDVRNSASGFPNRKYIQTLENGDVLFYTNNNDIQIKIQTNGDMVVGIEAPASLMFPGFPSQGIEQSALYQNMGAGIISTSPIDISPEQLAVYFDAEPYSFETADMTVMSDRAYEVSICVTQGTDGRNYIYPGNLVFMKLYVDPDANPVLGPGVR